ncbi:hypothetical protein HDR63_00205 [bacterium]|nr:hypothetical protein [bacterium]
MKKYTILTSVLALAACGGGHHGGGDVVTPSDITRVGTVTQAAAESNAALTPMVSEIGVLDGDADAPSVNIGRAAVGSFIHQGQKYNSYKLDNVELNMGDWGTAHFHVDENGKVDALVFHDNEKIESNVARQGNSDKFIVRFRADDLTDDKRDVKFSYDSYARDLGLKYADFGTFNGQSPWSGDAVAFPFMAGYEIKEIKNPTGKMAFAGLAKGSVAQHVDDHDQNQVTITDTNATLVFENGMETLTANFDKWYKMTITKDADHVRLDFDDTGKTISAAHKLAETMVTDPEKLDMTTKYYGNAADTKEATALINYYQFNAPDTNDNVNVTFGFGGVEKK